MFRFCSLLFFAYCCFPKPQHITLVSYFTVLREDDSENEPPHKQTKQSNPDAGVDDIEVQALH